MNTATNCQIVILKKREKKAMQRAPPLVNHLQGNERGTKWHIVQNHTTQYTDKYSDSVLIYEHLTYKKYNFFCSFSFTLSWFQSSMLNPACSLPLPPMSLAPLSCISPSGLALTGLGLLISWVHSWFSLLFLHKHRCCAVSYQLVVAEHPSVGFTNYSKKSESQKGANIYTCISQNFQHQNN